MSSPSASTKDGSKTLPTHTSQSSKVASSRMSVVSIETRKKQLEYQAAEEKTRLMIAAAETKAKLEEMKMQAEIQHVEKKLSASLAELDDQQQRRSRTGSSISSVSAAVRAENWVEQQNVILSRSAATHNARCSDPTAEEKDERYIDPAAAQDDPRLALGTQDVHYINPARYEQRSPAPVSKIKLY